MVRKHISRDFSAHKKSVIRPTNEYAKFEIFSYDPQYTTEYYYNKNIREKDCSNINKTTWRSWTCYDSADETNPMTIKIKYNVQESGDYRIDYLYEQSSYLHSKIEKNNTDKDLVGNYSLSQKGTVLSKEDVKFDGENQVLKRNQIFQHLEVGEMTLTLKVPHNCHFYGAIIRKIKKYTGTNDYSGESLKEDNLMLLDIDYSNSNMSTPTDLTVTIGYDSSYVCTDNNSGFYMDYRDECNAYIKDDDGNIQRIFGGYISSILPDDNRTKLTIKCSDRLIDGVNKYVLEEIVLQKGTKKLTENDYITGMEKSFLTYAGVLEFLCQSHETTLQSNIRTNYTVEGEEFHEGKIITFGSNKTVKKISPTNGTATSNKNFITLRNNSNGSKLQVFPLWKASDYGKTPFKMTDYPYFHITYGMGDPETSLKQSVTEKSDDGDTTGGGSWSKCGLSADKKYIMAIGQVSGSTSWAKKQGVKLNTYYKTIFENKCPYCGKPTVRWDSCRSDSTCIRGGTKRNFPVAPSETEITCTSCDLDMDSVTGYEKNWTSRHLKKVGKSVLSSKAEQTKLHKGKMSGGVNGGKELSADDVFKKITKIAFKYKYKLGGNTTSSYSAMKKAGRGDCWAFSDLIFTEMKRMGITCKIVQYGTTDSDAHRSVRYKNKSGNWVDFPYREYGWNTKYHNMLNNTAGSKTASYVKLYKGKSLGTFTITDSGSSKTETTTTNITKGYKKDSPFQGYIKIEYSLENNFKATKHSLYLNFTQKSDNRYAINGLSPVWVNNSTRKSTLDVNLVEFIQQFMGKKDIYLQSISFVAPVKKANSTTDRNDTDWFKSDKSTKDGSSCKMDLYQITIDDKKDPNPSELNSCGKTVNTLLKEVVEKAEYLVEMSYGEHRKDDKINFRVPNNTETVFTATEGDDINILGWGSITYNPQSTLFNTSIQVYKSSDNKYYYVDTHNTSSILKYGEQTTLSTSNEQSSVREAYFNAVHNDKYNPSHTYTYTITVPNYPNIRIGDLVKIISNDKKLNDVKEVKSIKISHDTGKMPRIRTEIGLDELSPNEQLKENVKKLKENAKKESTYFSSSAIPISEETVYEWDK